MHSLERTCLLALLLCTSARSEAGIQSRNMTVKNGNLHQQYKDRQTILPSAPAPASFIEETFTVNALIGQEAVLKCEMTSPTTPVMQIWKTETQSAHNCFMSARFDENKTFTNCSKHIQWAALSAGPSTLSINPVGIADDGRYTLESVIAEVGNIYCRITLKVQGVKMSGIGAWKFAPHLLWLSVAISFIITAAIIGFIFYWKPQALRQCYKFTCCQETSLQRDQQNAQITEVVEEVEPYASYMQKVNTIYCSITELGAYHMIDGSQMELRNIPAKDRH